MYIPHGGGGGSSGGSLEQAHYQAMHRPRSPSNNTLPLGGDDDDPYRSGEKRNQGIAIRNNQGNPRYQGSFN